MTQLTFTLADLLVLLVVIAVLFAYRQLDKRNRSLERVKRFSDQAQLQLQEVVDARSRELKDLGIEVEAQQQTFRSVLNHVQEATASLEAKAAELDALGQKVGDYERVIHELVDRTSIAQDNLQRIKEESRFIDAVGRRIKEASQKISDLEHRVPDLVREFSESNAAQHMESGRKILEEFQTRIKAAVLAASESEQRTLEERAQISQELENFQSQFDRSVEEYRISLKNLEEEYFARIRQAASEARSLEHEAFQALKLEFSDAHQSLRSEFLLAVEQSEAQINEALSSSTNALQQRIQRETGDLKLQAEQSIQASRQDLNELITSLVSEQSSMEDGLVSWRNDFESRLEIMESDVEEKLRHQHSSIEDRYARLGESLEGNESEFQQRFEELQRNQEDRFSEFRDLIENRKEDILTQIYQSEESLSQELETVRQKGNSIAEAALLRMNQDIEARSDSIRVQIEAGLEDLSERTRKTHGEIEDGFSTLQARLDSYLGETKQFIDETDQRMVEIQERVAEDQRSYESRMNEYILSSRTRIEGQEEELASQVQRLSDSLSQVRIEAESTVSSLRDDLSGRVESTRGDVLASIQSVQDEHSSALSEAKRLMDLEVRQIKARQEDILENLETELKHLVTRLGNELEVSESRFRELAQSSEGRFIASLEELEQGLQQQLGAQQAELDSRLRGLRTDLEQQVSHAGATALRLESLQEELDQKQTGISRDFEQRAAHFEANAGERFSALEVSLDRSAESTEQQVMRTLDSRLQDYEESFSYRIQALERLSQDVGDLESEMQRSLEHSSAQISEKLRQVQSEFEARQASELSRAQEGLQGLVKDLAAFEASLNELRQTAYESTAEQLKNFEDEFFADLRLRSESLDKAVMDWKLRVEDLLQEISASAESERRSLEQEYLDRLEQDLARIKSSTDEDIRRIGSQLALHRDSVDRSMEAQQALITEQDSRIRIELQDLHESAMGKLQDHIHVIQNTNLDRIASLESSVDGRLRRVETGLEDSSHELNAMFEAVRSDVTNWQNGFLQQLKSVQSSTELDLEQQRRKLEELLMKLKEDLEKENEALMEETSRERGEIRDTVRAAEERVKELYQSMNNSSSSILEHLSSQAQGLDEQVEQSLRDFRSSVAKTREEFDQVQKRLLSGLEERSSALEARLSEIEKEQKAFLAQTKLFERADSLKLELGSSIDVLKSELDRIRMEKKDFAEIMAQIERIKEVSVDAKASYDRLLSEKKRIDSMEGSMSRLLSFVQSVEESLAQVESQHDQLIEVQKSLRALSDLEGSVEQRYDRLEKKSGILETTIEGVDKNFHQLTELEQRFTAIYEDLEHRVPDRLTKIDAQLTQISLKKTEAVLAVKHMNQLDAMSSEIQSRLAEIQKGREWLARTETRFEEISRRAAEQVQLLGQLVKEELSDQKDGDEIPKSSRDLVIRLAHQGWKIEEIARTTKLSRGEIELILEMKPKS